MSHGLNVYHFVKNEGQKDFDLLASLNLDLLNNHNIICFETCLRKIWISNLDLSVHSDDPNSFFKTSSYTPSDLNLEAMNDNQAYHFLLEVLCGLKSPVIGETEVFGQFKNQVLKTLKSNHPLFKVMTSLVADTKSIRSKHLTNLGSSSYGSLARKYLAGFKSLDILGAGQFVQSLKPWIEKLDIHTHVYTRGPEKYLEVFKNSKWSLNIMSEFSPFLSEKPKALFICAPIELNSYDLSAYDLVMDFRDVSTLNQIEHKNLKVLAEIFQEIQKDNLLAEQKKTEALSSVSEASQNYFASMNHRPFGWDDLSA